MTKKEMSELFLLMMLAWPNGEMFKGGVQKLGPTIALWTECLPEVDFWTGQQAVAKLCRTCKFPPTIAEFREKADEAERELRMEIGEAWDDLIYPLYHGGAIEDSLAALPDTSPIKRAVIAMGGPDAVIVERRRVLMDGEETTRVSYDFDGFAAAYRQLARSRGALTGGDLRQLPEGSP